MQKIPFVDLFESGLHVSGDKIAHPQEQFSTVYTAFGTMCRYCCWPVTCLKCNPVTGRSNMGALYQNSGVPMGVGVGVGVFNPAPPPEIPKALQNRAKLNPILKTVKKLLNLGSQHPKMFGKKAVKF